MPQPDESESEAEDEDEDYEGGHNHGAGAGTGNGGGGGGGGNFIGDVDAASARDTLLFSRGVSEMVSSGFAEGHVASSLLMDIKGYKFAQNKVGIDF